VEGRGREGKEVGIISYFMYNESLELELTAPQHTAVKI
jgi:hypothetical protein